LGRYLVKRIGTAIPVLVLVSLIAFVIMRILPGDAASALAGPGASLAEVEAIRHMIGGDQPWYMQMLTWYGQLLRGDLGYSFLLNTSVGELLASRLPVTVSLALYAIALIIPIGIAAGVAAAYFRNSWLDTAIMIFSLLGMSLPTFWIGLMGVLLFSAKLGWLPSSGYVPLAENPVGWLRSLTMPAIVLAIFQIGLLARITRTMMLEVLSQDYIRTARAKGVTEWWTVISHALSNAMVPIVTVVGIIFGLLVTGAVVVEQVFALPGVGRLVVQSILNRDYAVVQAVLMLSAFIFVIINLGVDLLYAFFDPRVRYD
jgi:peptide/nickel transport system permease protein